MKLCKLFILVLILQTGFVEAQIMINEYSASNLNSFLDSYGKTEDWIELYNDGDVDVDISGYHLTDKEAKPEKWKIPNGAIIPAKGFLTFWCSGRDLSNGSEMHTNFKLSQTKNNEYVGFSDPAGDIIDLHKLELTLVEHSRARITDGGSEWMVCTNPSLNASNNDAEMRTGYTATPSIDLEAGFYAGEQTVTIVNNEPNSVLRITLNGTNPTPNSQIYSEPLSIGQTTVVKAQAFSNDDDVLAGKMIFRTYFIDEEYSLAVFSVAADQVLQLAAGQGELIPIGSIEYFDTDKELQATSFGSLNRHGQDSWVLPHRSLDWISRDEMGYSRAVEAPLFSYSDRPSYQRFMFRNSGDDNYPAINDNDHQGSTHIRDEYVQSLAKGGGLELDTRAVERVVLFLNGQYWGVYGMRERPVDHDYTEYYYDQDKYNLQYLTTWGTTDLEYGGIQSELDWKSIRNFALLNDLGVPENYQKVDDEINLLSLIDYMVMNLNVVASDWLNYNTGWWRGIHPDGGHKKWGYILWDLDATFDYYINYSGVPNTNPDADPCDLEAIGDYMDDFFDNGFASDINNPAECQTIINGSAPHSPDDPYFQQTVLTFGFCCSFNWGGFCQDIYEDLSAPGSDFIVPDSCEVIKNGSAGLAEADFNFLKVVNDLPSCCGTWNSECAELYDFYSDDGDVLDFNDVGLHEKILLKLIQENEDFKQLYYSRYTDIMNTVFTCDNMIHTLDSMLAVIEPEMPRQIARWGGTMAEWESNVEDLKDFILARCELLDDGALECYPELEGPYQVTLKTRPEGIGSIKFNTMVVPSDPWSGDYFGGMENKMVAFVNEPFVDEWEFSHWESTASNVITPNANQRIASIDLTDQDTITAVFTNLVSVNEVAAVKELKVFPNPNSGQFNLQFELEESAEIQISLYNLVGERLVDFQELSGSYVSGLHEKHIGLAEDQIPNGMYLLQLKINNQIVSRKLSVLR